MRDLAGIEGHTKERRAHTDSHNHLLQHCEDGGYFHHRSGRESACHQRTRPPNCRLIDDAPLDMDFQWMQPQLIMENDIEQSEDEAKASDQ